MGVPKTQHHQWMRRKKYAEDRHYMVWYYKQPFYESPLFISAGTMQEDTKVLEIYYHVKGEEYLNIRATERKLGRALKELFGGKKYICRVDQKVPLITVAFYTKVDGLPEPEKMEKVPELINSSLVEAGVDRWDCKTGEYQGRYYLSEFPFGQRHNIRKFCEGKYKSKQFLGSIWAFGRG